MCHLKSYAPGIGQGKLVQKGQFIGLVGKTGLLSRGPHLHWHLYVGGHVADPMLYLERNKEFAKKYIGKFILAVEDRGRVWYVTPQLNRIEIKVNFKLAEYLARNSLWIGMKNQDLQHIPIDFQY